MLPIVGATLVIVSDVVPRAAYFPIGLAIDIFSIGWLGTELVWYRQAFEGRPIQLGQLLPLTWMFIARYFWLLSLVLLLPILVAVPFAASRSLRPDIVDSLGFRTATSGYLGVVVALGTFMIPALAFSTRKVTEAIPIGLRMIAGGWPENWMYLVLPGLAAAALTWLAWSAPLVTKEVAGLMSAWAGLAFAGAIARYYLRHTSTLPNPPE